MTFRNTLKQRLKPAYRGALKLHAETFFAYTPSDLGDALTAFGIVAGDTVMVHSGFERFSGFTGSAHDIIEVLLATIGNDGNLLMMSMPYGGSSERYAATEPVFDVKRSPSVLGIISETFRRRQGVLRSINPLHPITATGPLAAWLTGDHDLSPYSCGSGSPFERFMNVDGKLLFIDAPYASMTFMHYVEDRYQADLPVDLYDAHPVTMKIKDIEGRERSVRQYFFSREAREHRNFQSIEQRLRASGAMQARKLGRSRLLCVAAKSVADVAGQLISEGRGFYR